VVSGNGAWKLYIILASVCVNDLLTAFQGRNY